ncbi:MAG TPA: O-antigen ligase family protein [Gaiellales bacterium]|nr:O-antigen ligase family protein [Gaiellales bacterium]
MAGGLVAVGALVVVKPLLAAVVVVLVVIAALVALARPLRIDHAYPAALLLLAGFVALPRVATVGSYSGLAVLTIVIVLAALPILLLRRRVRPAVPRPLLLFTAYTCVALVVAGPSSTGIQNVLIFLAFIAAIAVTASGVRSQAEIPHTIVRAFDIAAWTGVGVLAALLATGHGATPTDVLAPRPFAIFAVLALAWALARMRVERRGGLLAAAAIVVIVVSLSRGEIVAVVLLLSLNWVGPGGAGRLVVAAVTLALLGAGLFYATEHVSALHTRFYGGDQQTLDGVRINTEGRVGVWQATWAHWKTSPILGHGPGDADHISGLQGLDHPHNDFLRILDDSGLVGLALWLAGYFELMRQARRADRESRSPTDIRVAWAAFLALAGIGLIMLVDNPADYVFIMCPLGVLAGAALGIRLRGLPAPGPVP